MLEVHWVKSKAGSWLEFENFNLPTAEGWDGVYIIWHAGNPGYIVYIGQGNVRDRLGQHRNNAKILSYAAKGVLLVTWASVSAAQRDGVERYLADS